MSNGSVTPKLTGSEEFVLNEMIKPIPDGNSATMFNESVARLLNESVTLMLNGSVTRMSNGSYSFSVVSVVSLKDLAPGCGTLMSVIYGVLVPILALFVISVDSIIITVFTRPHVRSHTTYILTLIAIADICNITPPTVIYVYYYTFENYHHAIPYHLCQWTYLMADVCFDLFNAISLWLTVLLAYIRCRCLKAPFDARCLHKCRNISLFVGSIVFFELILHIPSTFLLNYHAIPRLDENNVTLYDCGVSDIDELSTSRKVHMWSEVLVDSFVPSCILLYLDISILVTLWRAKESRNSLRSMKSFRNPNTHSRVNAQINNGCSFDESSNGISKENGLSCEKDCVTKADGRLDHHQSGSHENGIRSIKMTNGAIGGGSCRSSSKSEQTSSHAYEYNEDNDADDNCCLCRPKRTKKVPTSTKGRNLLWQCCFRVFGRRKRQFYETKHKTNSNESAFDKLDRESRRTSWLILAVAALITTHEIPSAFLHVMALMKYNNSPLPMSMFGCWSAILNMWQYVIYPIIFLIYAWMSSIFRDEMCKVLKCVHHHDDDDPAKKMFLSPCSVRRTISRDEPTIHNSDDDSISDIDCRDEGV